jgi:hypothetical protein
MRKLLIAGLAGLGIMGAAPVMAGQEMDKASIELEKGLTVRDAINRVRTVSYLDRVRLCGTRQGLIPWQCRAIAFHDADEALSMEFKLGDDGTWRLESWLVQPYAAMQATR